MGCASAEKADKFNYTKIYNDTISQYNTVKYSSNKLKLECSKLEEQIQYSESKFSSHKKSILYSGLALFVSVIALNVKMFNTIPETTVCSFVSVIERVVVAVLLIGLLVIIVWFIKWLAGESGAILEQRKWKAQRDALRHLISTREHNDDCKY